MEQETLEKIRLQEEYCKKKQIPFFAPKTESSWCCGRNIWAKISKDKASSDLVTGCPYCCRSYVE